MRQKPLRDSLQSIWQLLLKPPRSPKTRKIWETAIAKKSLRRHYNWRNCSVLPHRINPLWECGTTKGHQVKSQEVYIRCKLQLITMYIHWFINCDILIILKYPPAMQETWVRYQGWKDSLEEGMATHSSILAWRTPMDRGSWQATVQGVAESRTWLSD